MRSDHRIGIRVAIDTFSGYWRAMDLGSNSPSIICSPVSTIKVVVIDNECAVGPASEPNLYNNGSIRTAKIFCP